jgi:hypothetical protein
VAKRDPEPRSQRDLHIAAIQTAGRLKWQATTNSGKRSLVETAMGRYKSNIELRLRASSFAAQQSEADNGVAILDQMLGTVRTQSARCRYVTPATA